MERSGIAIVVLLVILLVVALVFAGGAGAGPAAGPLGLAAGGSEALGAAPGEASPPAPTAAFELARAAVRVREAGGRGKPRGKPTRWGKQKTWKGLEGNPGAAAAFRADARKVRSAARAGRLDWAAVVGDMNDKLWRPGETWAARVGVGREVAGALRLEILPGGLARIGPPGPGDGGGLARETLGPGLAAESAASYADPECEETPDEFYSRPALVYLVTDAGAGADAEPAPAGHAPLDAARATAARALSRGRGAADAYLSPAGRIDLRLP